MMVRENQRRGASPPLRLASLAAALVAGLASTAAAQDAGSYTQQDEQDAAGARTLSDAALRAAAPAPLSTVKVPEPPDLYKYVRNKQAAILLGKALFWDEYVGSQGMACATCHFQAGADPRVKNQVSPGLLGGNGVFDRLNSGGGGPNYTLRKQDFPFHEKVDPAQTDRTPGNTRYDTDEVTSSAGVRKAQLLYLTPDAPTPYTEEVCDEGPLDPLFNVQGKNTRKVEPRNTPTVINAVFNMRNFWDGRANFAFNGLDPFGPRTYAANPEAGLYALKWRRCYPRLDKVQVLIEYCSLSSQAVGPPLSDFEMSCSGRSFRDVAKKLLRRRALASQEVHPKDSVLGAHRHYSGEGLWWTYGQLVRWAFQPEWWAAWYYVRSEGRWVSQMEANFSLYFGLAVQLYEATLVSDRTPLDAFARGDDSALSEKEKLGLEIFLNEGRCNLCHAGPELTDATVGNLVGPGKQAVNRFGFGPVPPGLIDVGFFNLGVRPTADDPGVGGADPHGNPLSYAEQLSQGKLVDDPLVVDPSLFAVGNGVPVAPGERFGVKGGFKVPSLRNVAYTAPYMHTGGMLTLEQVVDFYARGGNFPGANAPDVVLGIAPMPELLANPYRKAALVAFLKQALTDHRVVNESAPFDHPSLKVPHGTYGDHVATNGVEELLYVPAVGRHGRKADCLPPIETFEQRLPVYAPTKPQAKKKANGLAGFASSERLKRSMKRQRRQAAAE